MTEALTRPAPWLYVELRLKGGFDPSVIAVDTGLEASVTRRGEVSRLGGKVAKEDSWRYVIGPITHWDFEPSVRSLIKDLTPHWSYLQALIAQRQLSCVLSLEAWIPQSDLSYAPVVALKNDVLALLADLPAELEVDFNLLSDPAPLEPQN